MRCPGREQYRFVFVAFLFGDYHFKLRALTLTYVVIVIPEAEAEAEPEPEVALAKAAATTDLLLSITASEADTFFERATMPACAFSRKLLRTIDFGGVKYDMATAVFSLS